MFYSIIMGIYYISMLCIQELCYDHVTYYHYILYCTYSYDILYCLMLWLYSILYIHLWYTILSVSCNWTLVQKDTFLILLWDFVYYESENYTILHYFIFVWAISPNSDVSTFRGQKHLNHLDSFRGQKNAHGSKLLKLI